MKFSWDNVEKDDQVFCIIRKSERKRKREVVWQPVDSNKMK